MDLQLPDELDVARTDDLTVIVISRRTPLSIARLVAGLALVLFTAQWITSLALTSPLWLVVAALLALLGLWLVWSGTAHTFGKTTVYADDHAVQVHTGPLHIHRPVRVPMQQIAGFRVDHHVEREARGSTRREQVEALPQASSNPLQHWHVLAVLQDGEQAALVKGLPERRTAVTTRLLLEEHQASWKK